MSTLGLFRTARVEVISKDGVGRVFTLQFCFLGGSAFAQGGRIYIGACGVRLNETPFSQPVAPMATVAAGRGDSGGGSGYTFNIWCLRNNLRL